ncbi:helix-turn-helix domain-containing protein [Escherichia coli]
MGSCAAPSAKGDDKFITTDYLQQCQAQLAREFNISRETLYQYLRTDD